MAPVLNRLLEEAAEYLKAGRRVLTRLALLFLVTFGLVTLVPLDPSRFSDLSTASWFGASLAQHVLRALEAHLLPHGETLLVLGPFDAFSVLMEVGAGIAAAVTIPAAAYWALRWSWVGMYAHERYWARRLVPLLPLLFLGGVALALFFLPWLYAWGYELQGSIGAAGTVALGPFVSTTLIFTLGVGLAFEYPAVCMGLAALGRLREAALRGHWKAAVLGCFVLAWIISPGVGGGLIEVPIGLALVGLYALSLRLVRLVERRGSREESVRGVGAGAE